MIRQSKTPSDSVVGTIANPRVSVVGGWGAIEPGRLADLVVLDANPLADIANTQQISAVVIKVDCSIAGTWTASWSKRSSVSHD